MLTAAEVAALLRVDPKTVTGWARKGRLSSIRTLGGHRRYRVTEILSLLDPGEDRTTSITITRPATLAIRAEDARQLLRQARTRPASVTARRELATNLSALYVHLGALLGPRLRLKLCGSW
jgi:excisionase family DNA binding protein